MRELQIAGSASFCSRGRNRLILGFRAIAGQRASVLKPQYLWCCLSVAVASAASCCPANHAFVPVLLAAPPCCCLWQQPKQTPAAKAAACFDSQEKRVLDCRIMHVTICTHLQVVAADVSKLAVTHANGKQLGISVLGLYNYAQQSTRDAQL